MNKKTIPLRIDEDIYKKIKTFVQWVNIDNQIEGNKTHYTIDEFIRGSVLAQLEFIEGFLNSKNVIEGKENFKNRFKEIAKEKGVRQKDICDKLDIQKSYLSLIFSNQAQPRTELFFKIWALLGCPPIYKTIYFED